MIAVLDYGIGNLRSIEKALEHIGADARLVTSASEVQDPAGVVLPGVGAFGACANALRKSGLDRVALDAIAAGTPFLGVCVGFQLLFDRSEESPGVAGLSVIPGSVCRLPASERLPQIQWNRVHVPSGRRSAMIEAAGSDPWFYFVHSYAPVPDARAAEYVVGTCEYGAEIVAALEFENCWGAQFHPEKSGQAGLSLLGAFVARCDESNPTT